MPGFKYYLGLEGVVLLYKNGITFRVFKKTKNINKPGTDVTTKTLKSIAKYYYIDKLNEDELREFLDNILLKVK